ncbi:PH domain-containing protein [Streptomyces sp. NPDC059740]|uniref:PH domain-containing protein n=1 Tax=Streptomyces sp. NPDC059740 TaxID=3346926 RepID=UPI00365E7F35
MTTPPDGPPALPVTFRPTRTRAVLLSVGLAQFLVITAVALALPELTGGERASFVAIALVLLAGLLLLSRPKVEAHSGGVRVVNLTTTRELAWEEIVQVNLRPGDAWAHLDLTDGTSQPAMGIQPGIGRQRAIADARALRELTRTHTAGQ